MITRSKKKLGGLLVLAVTLAITGCNDVDQPVTSATPTTNTPWADTLSDTLGKARAGSAEAQNTLGKAYASGQGLPKDCSAAREWFLLAADQGHAQAQYNLGVLLMDKQDRSTKDLAEAREWLRHAANANLAPAQYRLAELARTGLGGARNPAQAVALYGKAAEQGHTRSQYNLGLMYQLGTGVEQSLSDAAHWFRLAAEQGLPEAQLKMGNLYHTGAGVEQNDAIAVRWYRKSAEAGYALAQSNLGVMYAAGRGVPQDMITAHAWMELAADAGIESSKQWQREIASKLTPGEKADAEKLAKQLDRGVEHRD